MVGHGESRGSTAGHVMGQCLPRHRHNEFLTFLKTIDRNVARGLAVHLIVDNYGTHTIPRSKNGWPDIPDSSCTSRPPPARGSTWSNAGSETSPTRPSGEGCSRASPRSPRRSTNTSPSTTLTRNRSCEQPRPSRSSPKCNEVESHSTKRSINNWTLLESAPHDVERRPRWTGA
jgi:hypothetical protein